MISGSHGFMGNNLYRAKSEKLEQNGYPHDTGKTGYRSRKRETTIVFVKLKYMQLDSGPKDS